MSTWLGKSGSFGLPRVPFVNCGQLMYLVISLLVLRAGCGIWLYQFLIISYLFTLIMARIWLCWDLTSQSTIFQSCRDGAIASWVINQYFRGVKCLAQGHNMAAVGLEHRTSRSGVRHSTTEPPRSPDNGKEAEIFIKERLLCFPLVKISFQNIDKDKRNFEVLQTNCTLTNLWLNLPLKVRMTFQHLNGLLNSLRDQLEVLCYRLSDPNRFLGIRVSQMLVVVHWVETILLFRSDVQLQVA